MLVLLDDDVSVPVAEPVAEPETEPEPDAEPEIEPDALVLPASGVVEVDVEDLSIVLELEELLAAGADEVSVVVVLLLRVSREQPGPKVNVAAMSAVAPNKPRFFLVMIECLH